MATTYNTVQAQDDVNETYAGRVTSFKTTTIVFDVDIAPYYNVDKSDVGAIEIRVNGRPLTRMSVDKAERLGLI